MFALLLKLLFDRRFNKGQSEQTASSYNNTTIASNQPFRNINFLSIDLIFALPITS